MIAKCIDIKGFPIPKELTIGELYIVNPGKYFDTHYTVIGNSGKKISVLKFRFERVPEINSTLLKII